VDDLALLKELLAIPSPPGEETALAEHLVMRMTELGFQAHRDRAGNAVGMLGDPHAGRTVVLLGHMDTVPGWIPVRQDGDRLFGRGAVDAKGPLAAFVLAAVRAAPRLTGTRLLVIGAVEEESHGRGARHLASTMPPPYCAIIGEPSDWQGITLGYKGMLTLDYRLLQPGGHSAGEFPGPAEKAVDFWNRLVAYAAQHNIGRARGFYTLDPALREFATHSNGLDDGVNLRIALRLPPDVLVSELQERIQAWCNGAQLKFYPSDPPFQADKNTPLVRALLRSIRAEGGRPRFKLKTGTADMNIVGPAWGRPIVAYGPGDSSLDHTPHEHVQIQEFLRATSVLTRALVSLGCGPPQP
jgi:LysW-gamma-L-lysine carboxypeptidase